ncbi:unnamed protein product [Paramecium octaurelia]|uniref:Uncharacterized protein n=1 Tax=Paramecium octaurelia TaxID=43137 RepID=A0A8S1V6H1_PAROT|nr:unnamed protein product [Paramecium octaurelia]
MKQNADSRSYKEQNIYFIKSIQHQKLIGFYKSGIQFEFCDIDPHCGNQFQWILQSDDQNEQKYEFRFGEYVLIQNLAKNIPINNDKVPLLLKFSNGSIDSQVFNKCSNNLIGNQPCVFKNNIKNLYFNIEKCSSTYTEQPSYFQIIPKCSLRTLSIQRPICHLIKDFQIRNYFTGYCLSFSNQFETEKYLTIKNKQTIPQDYWRISSTENNVYELYNPSQRCYIQNLSMEKEEESKYLYLSSNQPKHHWRIICPQKKEISFGVPFLIQDMLSGSFINIDLLDPKDDQSSEFGVVLKKNIDNTALWVVFYMK